MHSSGIHWQVNNRKNIMVSLGISINLLLAFSDYYIYPSGDGLVQILSYEIIL